MHRQSVFIPIILFVLAGKAVPTARAESQLVVGGNPVDWGVNLADGTSSNKTPSTFNFRSDIGLQGSMVEDTNDTSNSYNVGPGGGGQNYDAEALAVAVQQGKLFGLIVSGQRPDNGFSAYAPGDIRITTASGNVYGIEVGGGRGGGSGSTITEGAAGSTYELYSSGSTKDHTSHSSGQVAGSLWKNPDWLGAPVGGGDPVQMQMSGGEFIDLVDYAFTRNSRTNQHSVIEFAVDLSAFAGDIITSLGWQPACGNDELLVSLYIPVPGQSTSTVPEPGSLALALLGGAFGCFGWIGRRRNRKQSHRPA